MTVRYRRARGATSRRVGSALFLASSERGTVLRVSSSVAAVWNVLGKPLDAQGIVGIFRAAFPARPLRQLRADVAMMLRDLVSEALVERLAQRRAAPRRRPRTRG